MIRSFQKNHLFKLLILFVILLSYRFFSGQYYSALNSDNAVSVLMLHYFELPRDWYYWGQDRLGSLVPMLGSILHAGLNVRALVAESIVHYMILVLGYLAFASFLTTRIYKFIFAIFWFFPPMHMIDIIQLSFGIQYSLLGICCYLVRYKNETLEQVNYKYHLILLLVSFISIVLVWVSDLALFSMAILIIFNFINTRNTFSLAITRIKPDIFYVIFTLITGFFVISYFKSTAPRINYFELNTLPDLLHSFKIFFDSIIRLLTFQAHEPVTGIYMYFVFAIIIFLVISKPGVLKTIRTHKWIAFFVVEAMVIFSVIMMSKWTLDNNVPRRYFTCTYITLGLAFLMTVESLTFSKKRILNYAICITVMLGGIGTIHNHKYIFPVSLTPKSEVMAELDSLGNIGIIGEYWNSYICAVNNPDQVVATPHDKDLVRNALLAEKVFQQERLFINKDMWMEEFPDTLVQFGRTLVRHGNSMFIGGSFMNEYKILQNSAAVP